MSKYIWDIEANGFTKEATELWMSVFLDIETKEVKVFTDHDDAHPSISESFELMDNAEAIIGHNLMRYDLPVFERLTGYRIDRHKIIDTMILSKLNDFHRKAIKGFRKHNLKMLAQLAGEAEKQDYDGGFDAYSPDMLSYCIDDVKANLSVYNMLLREKDRIIKTNPKYDDALNIEHQMSYWSAQQTANGWAINEQLLTETMELIKTEVTAIEGRVEPKLGTMEVMIDKEPKTPKYKKNGEYTVASARILSDYLGMYVDPSDALSANPPIEPETEFQRSQVVEARLGNQEHLKEFLYGIGWKPTQWNYKKNGSEWIRLSPKLSDDSLEALGEIGKDIGRYFTLRARHSILTGWLEHIHDSRLYGDVFDFGAATGRQTHQIIANIPSPNAAYGSEIRKMFNVPQGKTLISADGASYQARVAAHFAKKYGDNGEEFLQTILEGDIHQANADAWQVSRNAAKPGMFALFFGCGAAKLARILEVPENTGKKRLEAFYSRWPCLRSLQNQVKQVAQTRGWLKGLDGRRIYTEEPFKAFNYLIQGTEALLMKRTICRINEAFEKEGIEAKQLLFYHDEVTYEIDPKDAKRAEELIAYWFAQAPKELGVDIMEAGDIKVGNDYLEVH